MFSFGESPNLAQNENLTGEEIVQLLKQGIRLERPQFCPQNVYDDLMLFCWKYESKQRPAFAEILNLVRDQLYNGEVV
jgi:Protein tyrosine and serine/threonine kinase